MDGAILAAPAAAIGASRKEAPANNNVPDKGDFSRTLDKATAKSTDEPVSDKDSHRISAEGSNPEPTAEVTESGTKKDPEQQTKVDEAEVAESSAKPLVPLEVTVPEAPAASTDELVLKGAAPVVSEASETVVTASTMGTAKSAEYGQTIDPRLLANVITPRQGPVAGPQVISAPAEAEVEVDPEQIAEAIKASPTKPSQTAKAQTGVDRGILLSFLGDPTTVLKGQGLALGSLVKESAVANAEIAGEAPGQVLKASGALPSVDRAAKIEPAVQLPPAQKGITTEVPLASISAVKGEPQGLHLGAEAVSTQGSVQITQQAPVQAQSTQAIAPTAPAAPVNASQAAPAPAQPAPASTPSHELDLSNPAALRSESIKLAAKLRVAANGASEAKLLLHPDSLGQVHIKMELSGGKISAKMMVENHAAEQALQSALPHLDQAFRSQGFSEVRILVANGNAGFAWNQDNAGRAGDQGGSSRGGAADKANDRLQGADKIAEPMYAGLTSQGRINIVV